MTKQPSLITQLLTLIAVIALAGWLLQGCGTPTGIAVANFLESPANTAVVGGIVNGESAALIESATGKTNLTADQQSQLTAVASTAASGVSTGVLWAIGEALRTKQGTIESATAGNLAPAIVNQAGATAAVAQPIAQAVQNLAASGVPPQVANEAVALAVQSVPN
jgi:hypothetical protein